MLDTSACIKNNPYKYLVDCQYASESTRFWAIEKLNFVKIDQMWKPKKNCSSSYLKLKLAGSQRP